ncbi:anti-sigma factor family protein [Sphingomonas sp. PAMC 26605]|uniref:anti-sigma factor family protein n=1 Tax=Sphingomonas sp. PAMC 26605 TaxID=1112214 RepID=UPI00026CB58C|nr:zf-HC2 domain-containing protein [Sphingomonas sp. PAMC 26605]
MDEIASTFDDRHRAAMLLLPWYATGQLEAADQALVKAHLLECDDCRAELEMERRLARAIAAQTSDLTPSWNTLQARIDAAPRPVETPSIPRRDRSRRRWAASTRRAMSQPRTLRWVVAAQFVGLLVLGGLAIPTERAGPYRVLGDAPAVRTGNVLAMFRPGTSEAELRRVLLASGARLVDGPTSAGAWVLDVPGGSDGTALKMLRADKDVAMAEPIEQAPAE